MDFTKKTLLTDYIAHPDVIGSIVIEDTSSYIYPSDIDGFDMLLMVVCDSLDLIHETTHIIDGTTSVQVHRVSPISLERWVVAGENRNIIQWLLQGEILQDREHYLEKLRNTVAHFENPLREQRMLAEFALFLRTYIQSKRFMQLGHVLDAYYWIMEALHHWAGIALIEQGVHPEVTVWNQVRDLNVGVYKLYEELTISQETVEQRVQLVLLACEFSVMSKMKDCCSLLLRIISSRPDPWSILELIEHPELCHVRSELPLLMQKLVRRSLVQEVDVLQLTNAEPSEQTLFTEIRYL